MISPSRLETAPRNGVPNMFFFSIWIYMVYMVYFGIRWLVISHHSTAPQAGAPCYLSWLMSRFHCSCTGHLVMSKILARMFQFTFSIPSCPESWILNPASWILHPASCILHPESWILNTDCTSQGEPLDYIWICSWFNIWDVSACWDLKFGFTFDALQRSSQVVRT